MDDALAGDLADGLNQRGKGFLSLCGVLRFEQLVELLDGRAHDALEETIADASLFARLDTFFCRPCMSHFLPPVEKTNLTNTTTNKTEIFTANGSLSQEENNKNRL